MLPEILDGSLFGTEQQCFGCGVNHPHGMRLKYTRTAEGVEARMTPTDQHQGPPGIMHGGLVSTLADETAAWAIIASTGKFGFTTSFEAKFRSPVRVGSELVARSRVTSTTSRIIKTEVTISQGEKLCFTGDFTFAMLSAMAAERLTGIKLPEEWKRFTR